MRQKITIARTGERDWAPWELTNHYSHIKTLLKDEEVQSIQKSIQSGMDQTAPTDGHRHSGADWIERQPFGKEMSPFGRRVADLLGLVFLGIYHVPEKALSRVDWWKPGHMELTLNQELATYDGLELTWLILLAHHMGIRVSVRGVGPGYLRVLFFIRKRRRGGWISDRHPNIHQAIRTLERYAGTAQMKELELEEETTDDEVDA